jgi:hypothetical protein
MEYNSQKEILVIPEYGRNIQNMIDYAKTIEDDEYRQHFVEKIIDLMNQMNPQYRNLNEYRDKLWKHVFRIAKYDLKVVPPSGDVPEASESLITPSRIEYPPTEKTFRHYGHNVKQLIKKALEMEDLEKRQEFVDIIGSYMKMAYRTWNREHYVSDEIVKGDLTNMSGGVLVLSDGLVLDTVQNYSPKKWKRSTNYKGKNNGRGRDRDRHRNKGRRK